MDIRVLRYFLTTAREGNITRAAEILHVAQPSLSKQLMNLEEEIGKRLFIRGKRKITLTEDGKFLFKRAEELVSLFDKTEKEITADSQTINGEISIGGGVGTDSIIKTAAQLIKNYPDVNYYLYSCDAEEVLERLDNGTLDFGILIDQVDNSKYDYIQLPEKDIWGLLMRKDSPLSEKTVIYPEDLESLPLILPKRPGLQREFSNWINKDIQTLNIIATFNIIYNNPSLFVKNNLGYAFALKNLIDLEENSQLCFRPLAPLIEIHFYIFWKKHRTLSKAAAKFIDILKNYIDTYF